MVNATLVMLGYSVRRAALGCETMFELIAEASEIIVAVLVVWNNRREQWPGCAHGSFVEGEWRRSPANSALAFSPRIYFATRDRPDNLFTVPARLGVPSEAVVVMQDDVNATSYSVRCLVNIWAGDPRLVVGPPTTVAFGPESIIDRPWSDNRAHIHGTSIAMGTRCRSSENCLFWPRLFCISIQYLRQYAANKNLLRALNGDLRCEDHAIAAIADSSAAEQGIRSSRVIALGATADHHRNLSSATYAEDQLGVEVNHRAERLLCGYKVSQAMHRPMRPSSGAMQLHCMKALSHGQDHVRQSIAALQAKDQGRPQKHSSCCAFSHDPRGLCSEVDAYIVGRQMDKNLLLSNRSLPQLPAQPEANSSVRLARPRKKELMLSPHDAVVAVDVWDRHWCPTLERWSGQLAPSINRFLIHARRHGAGVVHAVADVLDGYLSGPQANQVQRGAPAPELSAWGNCSLRDVRCRQCELLRLHPPSGIPPSVGWEVACPDQPLPKPYKAWHRISSAISINETDVILEDGADLVAWLSARRPTIKRLIYVGAHLDQCVLWTRSYSALSMLPTVVSSVGVVRSLTQTTAPGSAIEQQFFEWVDNALPIRMFDSVAGFEME